MTEPPPGYGELIRQAQANECRRAVAGAATIRLVGAAIFLGLVATMGFGLGHQDWGVYVPKLAPYVAVAFLTWQLRQTRFAVTMGAIVAVADVAIVFLLQSEAMPLSPHPAGVAGFSLGLFALLVCLSGLTLNVAVLFVVTLASGAAQVLLMRQADLSFGPILAAMVVLPLVAAVNLGGARRLRLLAVDLLRAEVNRAGDSQRFTELATATSEIQELLARSDRQNQRLSNLQRDKDSLIQLIVHDLRNPLTAVFSNVGYANDLLRPVSIEPSIRESLQDAISAARRLDGLISDMLELSRLEDGKLTLSPTLVAPTELLEQIRRQASATARMRSVELEVSVTTRSDLLVDVRLLTRVLENLVLNAIRYSPPGERVLMAAASSGDEELVSVHNNGPKIDPADRPLLFQKYHQGKSGSFRNTGWGLGLHFCSVAAQAVGGRIAIEDVATWNTSFVLHLPAASRDES